MSNHKTKRRDGPTSDYVRPLTTEEKERGVKVHPLPIKPEADAEIIADYDAQHKALGLPTYAEYIREMERLNKMTIPELLEECKFEDWRNFANSYDETCGMMPDDEWRRVRDHLWTGMAIKEACDLIPESPMVMFGIALKMELDMMAAIWEFEDYGLDDPIATPKIAPAKMTVPVPQAATDRLPDFAAYTDRINKQSEKNDIKSKTGIDPDDLEETWKGIGYSLDHWMNREARQLPNDYYLYPRLNIPAGIELPITVKPLYIVALHHPGADEWIPVAAIGNHGELHWKVPRVEVRDYLIATKKLVKKGGGPTPLPFVKQTDSFVSMSS